MYNYWHAGTDLRYLAQGRITQWAELGPGSLEFLVRQQGGGEV